MVFLYPSEYNGRQWVNIQPEMDENTRKETHFVKANKGSQLLEYILLIQIKCKYFKYEI